MLEYASIRFTFSWVAAAKFPSVIVTTASAANTTVHGMPIAENAAAGNASKKSRNPSANPAAFEAEERKALTGAGAPS